MNQWINVGHVQFDIFMFGQQQQIIGKLIAIDKGGCTIVKESDGTTHTYAIGVIQHVTLAP